MKSCQTFSPVHCISSSWGRAPKGMHRATSDVSSLNRAIDRADRPNRADRVHCRHAPR